MKISQALGLQCIKTKRKKAYRSAGLKGWFSSSCCSQCDTEWITHPLPILSTTQWPRANHNHKQQKTLKHASKHVSCLLSSDNWALFLNYFLVQSCTHAYVHSTVSPQNLVAQWRTNEGNEKQNMALVSNSWSNVESHVPPTLFHRWIYTTLSWSD